MTDEMTFGPPRLFVPICILYPHGFQCGPAGYEERERVDDDTGPIIIKVEETE